MHDNLSLADDVRYYLEALPELAEWPEVAEVFRRAGDSPRPDWELPLLACEAVGGRREMALPAAAAVACLQVSIILVDDLLDDDPRGEHLRQGEGATANMAQAFLAASFRILSQSEIEARQKSAAIRSLAGAALATAVGQQLDIQNLEGEQSYWRVVEAKSTPFYGSALEIGALIGGANRALARNLHELGVLFGEMIQIDDDLVDALETPANADWRQGRNNLLILYARTAAHEQRSEFEELLDRIDDPGSLARAQEILTSCGAVSYALFQLVRRYRRSTHMIELLRLPHPRPLEKVLEEYGVSLAAMLNTSGTEIGVEKLA